MTQTKSSEGSDIGGRARPDAVNVAMIVPRTEAEGPGARFALWVQGCPMRCPRCCNPEMLPFESRDWISVEELCDKVDTARSELGIEGITLLGGEPFAQGAALALVAEHVRSVGLTVMTFSGFRLDELQRANDPHKQALLAATDLLVDGRYEHGRPDLRRRWIGSENQRTLALSPAYKELVASWDISGETVEIRLVGGRIVANGSPGLVEKFRC